MCDCCKSPLDRLERLFCRTLPENKQYYCTNDAAEWAIDRIAELESQLPEGMKNCTITFHECKYGHGRLTATNWVDHGCPTCARLLLENDIAERREEYAILKAQFDKLNKITSEPPRSNTGLGRWISVDDRMPPKEKYVFIHLTKNNWNDSSDSEGAVAMLLTGISKAEREALKSSVVEADLKRAKIYRSEDEWLNNLRPYCWDTFGLSKYFGQEVDFWMEIPPLCFN